MGSLHSIPLSELVSSLEILARAGVTTEDITDIRVYPEFARELSEMVVRRRKIVGMALGREEAMARMAVEEISDRKLLIYIAKWARLESAAERAMKKLHSCELSEIARNHEDLERARLAARFLPTAVLQGLLRDPRIHVNRREMLAGELAGGYY